MTDRIPHPLYENAYIYKQTDSKNWFMDYKNANGKRTRKTSGTSDKREAFRILSENLIVIKKVRSGEITLTDSTKITVDNAVAMTIKFYKDQKNKRPIHTVYVRHLLKFADRFGDLRINEVNTKVLREFLSQNYGERSLGMYITPLSMMFTLCKEGQYISEKPDFPDNIPTIPSKQRDGLKKYQIDAIIHRFTQKSLLKKLPTSRRRASPVERENARITALLATTLYRTGARLGELRYLSPSRIWEERIGDKTFAFLDIKESKTKPRKILIPYSLYYHLKDHQRIYNFSNDDLFFKNRANGKVSTEYSRILLRDFENNRRFYDEIDVSNICLYRFRHSFIIERLLEGKHILMISQHCATSIPMIQKYYSSFIVASNYENIYSSQPESFLDEDGKIMTPDGMVNRLDEMTDMAREYKELVSNLTDEERQLLEESGFSIEDLLTE